MPIYKMSGKKDGRQKYRVRINYIDNFGKPKQIDRVAYGSEEAKQLEHTLQLDIKKTLPTTPRTVKKLYEEYIEYKKYSVRQTTYEKLDRVLKKYILPELSDCRVDKITTSMLQKWKTNISKLDLSVRSRRNIYSELRALLNYAERMEYINKSPLRNVENFKDVYFEMPQDKLQYYTAEQFKKYITFAMNSIVTNSDWNYYVFFYMAYFTGMRKGEINALKWSDIDGNVINVKRSIAQKLKGGDMETPPKNKSSYRSLQIPIPLKDILDAQKKRQMQNKDFSNDYRVCGGDKCLRDTSIENKNKTCADGAGLPHIRIHDFRHSHASLLANEGINIQEVARRLGHAKVDMTWNTYSHLYPREEERAMQVLNAVMK